MNKNCYRIIFNKARGILMAVAEIVVSRNSSAGTTRGVGALHACSRAIHVRLRCLTFWSWVALGLLTWPVVGQTEIVADRNAPKNQQPTVLNAANNVPQINIQTPSAAGVSRNTYSRFDVQQRGVILNNSRIDTQTQLGGWIQGNPWLATGTARVILNEVHSTNPSQLHGYIEVAGSRAQVVIANPVGVTCSGCGFINASRSTITTGTPILNGGNLEGYRVQGGKITITGAGMDAGKTDYSDLIARSVQINAGIWANQLKITTGTNRVNASHSQVEPISGNSPVPIYGIDVAQLGGMYAGKITLVGTENGVGVRNAGTIGASAGEVIITADGLLENMGHITSTANIRIDSRSGIENSGTIYAQSDATLTTVSNIDNSGIIAAQNNTTLTANGTESQVISTNTSALGAGVQTDGNIGATGTLTIDATREIVAKGRNLSGGDQSLAAQNIDLSGSQTSASNLSLKATGGGNNPTSDGNINAASANITVDQSLTLYAAQTLRTDHAKLSAHQINVTAHDMTNTQGEIIQTGSGDLILSLPGKLDNTEGRIASNSRNLEITTTTLNNTDGKLEHASSGEFTIDVTTLNGTRGQIGSNGLLDLKATTATLDAGTTVAQQLTIDTATLSNRGGSILQTDSENATIKATTLLDNTEGTIDTSGDITLTLGDLINQGGTLQASGNATDLTITASGTVNNSAQNVVTGKLAATGNTHITATSLNNTQSRITAVQALDITVTETLTNGEGTLAAKQQVDISGRKIDNTQGTIGSVQSQTTINATSDILDNTHGRIEAATALNITAKGTINTDGVITGNGLVLNSREQTLNNTRGKLITTGDNGALTINSGTFNNNAGLIQAKGVLDIDTHGQTLSNTQSGENGGIIGQKTTTLTTAKLDNHTGYIGSGGTLTTHSAEIDNTENGHIVSSRQITLNGSGLENQSGKIQAQNNLTIKLGEGKLDNTSGLIRSGETLAITANHVDNSNTQSDNLGLEGKSGDITARQIDNTDGAIRADETLTLSSDGNIDNTRGLISSRKTATLQDSNLNNKTLTITNTDGTLIAGRNLTVDSAELSGDGKLQSLGDLSIKLTHNYTHTGQLQANGNATLETTGTLTNQSTLQAVTSLKLKAATIDNQVNGEISANRVTLEATSNQTLTNRGLIDGQETIIETITLNNLGTGRIYGDHVAIGTTTLTNDAEGGTAPVIAARDRLDIGATTINNREHALIFSAGDMAIGGALDADKRATGQADILNNNSATIEALGTLDLAARRINNTNEHFTTKVETLKTESIVEYQGDGSSNRYREGTTDVYVYTRYVPIKDIWIIHDDPGPNELQILHTPQGDYDKWKRYNYTRTTTGTKIENSDPAQIFSGSAMKITADHLLNDKSHIIAGGNLIENINNLDNIGETGERTITDAGSVTSYRHILVTMPNFRVITQTSDYRPAATVQSSTPAPTIYKQNTAPSGTDTLISELLTGKLNLIPDNVNSVDIDPRSGSAITPITQVALLNGSPTGGPATVVRSGGISIRIPDNRLYQTNPNPNTGYLIETDPRFTSRRSWLSSDYMLKALAIDPALTQKRLGDGFYEQKLVREQVAQLTGRRFLNGYADDEAQYQALMNNAVTYAKAHQLRPGIALSAAQMAQLTSDIIWLVEKEITLADGTTRKALVPQLYVMVQEGDLETSGALIASDGTLDLNMSGNLTNQGTIAGRSITTITAENIHNLGGRIHGNDVAVSARTDLTNLGGLIEAGISLNANAGRDINVTSTTRTQTSAQGNRSNIDRIAGLYVTGGDLTVNAGRDINLKAAVLQNRVSGNKEQIPGSTSLTAGRDLNLTAVTKNFDNTITWQADNWDRDVTRSETGTTIHTSGDLKLQAENDLIARAANISSDQGTLIGSAGGNIRLSTGEEYRLVDKARKTKRRSLFSKKTVITRDTQAQTSAQATTFSGNTTTLLAQEKINVIGSNIVSTQDTILAAENINIEAATETTAERHIRKVKKSGLFSSGGISLTLGTQKQSFDGKTTSKTAVASTVGSIKGNVVVRADKNYQQVGSHILTPEGDIDIAAQRIDILEAQNSEQSRTETRFSQSGLTVAIKSPIIDAAQTTRQMAISAGKTKDPRMKALAVGTAALAGKNAYDSVTANPSQAGGINLSISLGSSKSQSTTEQNVQTVAASTLIADNNILITAAGAEEDSDLTIRGSDLKADKNITLKADDKIYLGAAKSSDSLNRKNSSNSGSIGISFGTDGLLFNVSASKGKGKADGTDIIHTNTRVQAGNTVTLQSGADTEIKGAVVSGNRVIAEVDGNLTIESLQDTSHYNSKQQNISGSISVGYGKMGGSLNIGKEKIKSNYASVIEQSGIKAGDDGFQIQVKENTDLKGAIIASTDKAAQENRNSLTTGSLTTSDIQNKAEYKAQGFSLGIGYSSGGSSVGKNSQGQAQSGGNQTPGTTLPSLNGLSATAPIAISAKGNEQSTTRSGISDASLDITDEQQQLALTGKDTEGTIAELNRDVSSDIDQSNALTPIFDEEEIKAGFAITSAFAREAGTFLENRAKQADSKIAQAKKKEQEARDPNNNLNDPQRQALLDKADTLKSEAQTISDNWGPGGTYRQITTALVAAASGNTSAAAGEFTKNILVNAIQQQGSSYLGKLVEEGILTEGSPLHAALHAITACAGAAASNQSCSAGAMGGAAASLLTNLFSETTPDETNAEREAKRNLIASLVTGIAVTSGTDAATANNAAIANVDNNYLTPKQQQIVDQKIAECNGHQACEQRMADAARNQSKVQDIRLNKARADAIGSREKIDKINQYLKDQIDPEGTAAAVRSQHPEWSDAEVQAKTDEYIAEYTDSVNKSVERMAGTTLSDVYNTYEQEGAEAALKQLAIDGTIAVAAGIVLKKAGGKFIREMKEIDRRLGAKRADTQEIRDGGGVAEGPEENNLTKNNNDFDTDSEAAGFSQYDQYRNTDGSWKWPKNDGFVPSTIKQEILPVGAKLDRYGSQKGGFLAPKGTPSDQRALAPGSMADGYHEYEVIKPLPIKSGKTAPAFGQSGGGTQYKIINPETELPVSAQWLLDNKYIRNVGK